MMREIMVDVILATETSVTQVVVNDAELHFEEMHRSFRSTLLYKFLVFE